MSPIKFSIEKELEGKLGRAGTLGSIHNLYFIINLVKRMRQAILDNTFETFKIEFLKKYEHV